MLPPQSPAERAAWLKATIADLDAAGRYSASAPYKTELMVLSSAQRSAPDAAARVAEAASALREEISTLECAGKFAEALSKKTQLMHLVSHPNAR